jgi:GT2 family glycosyltransferase
MAHTTDPLVTIVIVPRERFSYTRESLESVLANTKDTPYRLVYVDGGSPEPVRDYLRTMADSHDFTLVRSEAYLAPNHARNLAMPHVKTKYVLFYDNDVVVTPGWLSALIACAEETGGAVVTPLVCEGVPEHTVVHCAGGDFQIEEEAASGRRVVERMHLQKRKVADVRPKMSRTKTTLAEFHCMLVRSDIFDRIGLLDPEFLNTKEHLDFCMSVMNLGETIWFEPASLVTYIFNKPLERSDYAYFMLRWSDAWEVRSLKRFMAKWNLAEDDYFRNRFDNRGWRRHLAIWRPVARQISFGKRNKVLSRALWMLDRAMINPIITRRHRKLENAQAQLVHQGGS